MTVKSSKPEGSLADRPGSSATTALSSELDDMIHSDGRTALAKNLDSLVHAEVAPPTDLSGIAAQAAGAIDPKIGQALSGAVTAAGAVQALAQGGAAGAVGLAEGVLQTGAVLSPQIAQAAKFAPLAKSALGALGLADNAPRGVDGLDDALKAGSAILPADASAPMQNFAPSRADRGGADAAQAGSAALGYDESQRLLRLYSPLGGDKKLLVRSIEGEEELSRVGGYALELASQNPAIDHKDVLSKNLTVAVRQDDGSEHPINGYVSRFGYASADGALSVYAAYLVPWLWFLGKRVNSRIYQNLGPAEVLQKVFADYGALADFEFRIYDPPAAETYLTQYNESDLHFVSRVMERYGLFYYFEHRADGHTLIVCDDSTHPQGCPAQERHAVVPWRAQTLNDSEQAMTRLSSMRELQPSSIALNTYRFKEPGGSQYLELPSIADQGDVPALQVYDGNPAYAYANRDEGEKQAQRRLESYEWQAKRFTAQTDCRAITAGRTLRVAEHPLLGEDAENCSFLVVGRQLCARNNYGRTEDDAEDYRNTLSLIRSKIPYRPVRAHAKPVMAGAQTATVVGPSGKEIHTDEFGRIKVQFPWDRYGGNDDSSSCWIRVSQPWAGRGWGTVAIPRVNQEVIVSYLEGDPDRPVVLGRLFNAEQLPPRSLPDAADVMGFVSRSTPGGGGFCEMTICDRKGQELINLHSQKDMAITVQDSEAHVVVKGNRQVALNTGDESKNIAQGSLSETIAKKRSTQANSVQVTAKGGAAGPGTQLYEATDQVTHRVGDGSVTMTKTNIVIKFGPSSITLSANGIFIDGPVIHLNKDKG